MRGELGGRSHMLHPGPEDPLLFGPLQLAASQRRRRDENVCIASARSARRSSQLDSPTLSSLSTQKTPTAGSRLPPATSTLSKDRAREASRPGKEAIPCIALLRQCPAVAPIVSGSAHGALDPAELFTAESRSRRSRSRTIQHGQPQAADGKDVKGNPGDCRRWRRESSQASAKGWRRRRIAAQHR